jgi:DNA-binding MarR family transcriptional regulator
MKANGDIARQKLVGDLLHRASQLADNAFLRMSTAHLTPRQFAVLSSVSDEDALSQTDIVERTGIDRSTLAELIPRLLSKGLLRRSRSTQDARRNEVQLTARGRSALQSALAAAQRTDEIILQSLTNSQRKTLLVGLAAIADSRPKTDRQKRNGP